MLAAPTDIRKADAILHSPEAGPAFAIECPA
jgi:hypothetical protein